MNLPTFSIVLPAYNAERCVGDAIQSVLDQTFQDFELIIIDDGSVDRTLEVCRAFRDERIRIVTQQNRGAADARNSGVAVARGEHIAFIDSDDRWGPTQLGLHLIDLLVDDGFDVNYSGSPWGDAANAVTPLRDRYQSNTDMKLSSLNRSKLTRSMMLIGAALAAVTLTGCATTRAPGLGTALDAATTAYALDHGYSEANPLLSPIGDPYLTALAAVGVKQGIKYSLHEYGGLSEDCAHYGVETAGMAAGGWNLAVLAGAATGPGLIVGLLFGAGYWMWADGETACQG
ncbi:glycosyltransferase family 2 protein [Salinicola halimionae]|uniref:glycosyltransferase family 2 protein n=1 Tax=Salinicola halimionae TaxID=1949081 RepID=UPI000DA160D2|nr:glycosyltransferase family 2 protein [Salinicola halimionae]